MAIGRIGKFQARPEQCENLREFLISLLPLIKSSRGCESVQLYQQQEDPTRFTMLEVWLREKPNERLVDAWKKYARGIWEQLTEHERVLMREGIVGKAREIAEAAGGFIGVRSISPQERALLEELEKVLS